MLILLLLSLAFSPQWSHAGEPTIDKRPLAECFAGLPRSNASGKVVDPSGKAVPDADVFLYYSHGLYGTRDRLAARTKSGADGSFEFKQAMVWEPITEIRIEEPPKYIILARHASLGLNYKILLQGEPAEGITIPLRPTRSDAILLRDPAGRPIAGAHVYLHMGWMAGQEGPEMDRAHSMFVLTRDIGLFSGQTDSDGRVQIPIYGALPDMDFTAEKEGFTKTTVRFPYFNQPASILFPSGRLEGTITWPDGSPASDIAVHFRYVLSTCQEGPLYSTLTDTHGHYVFKDTPANGFGFPNSTAPAGQTVTGKVQLWVEDLRPASRCLPDLAEVSIDAGQRVVRDFRLRPACVIEGTVIDEATSRTVPNMNIACLCCDPFGQIKTDDHGRFRVRAAKGAGLGLRLDQSESGEYLIDWRPGQDRNQCMRSFQQVTRDISNLTIKTRLRPVAPLKGRVVRPSGSKGAEVWVLVDNELPYATADDRGTFSLKAVPADRDFDVLAIEACQDGRMAGTAHVLKGSREVTIPLEPLVDHCGLVKDQHGESVKSLFFSLHPCLNGFPLYTVSRDAVTDAKGQCTIGGLFPRLPWLARWNPCWSYLNHQQNQNVESGEAPVDLTRVPRGGLIRLQVKQYQGSLAGRIISARDGRPVAGARMEFKESCRLKGYDHILNAGDHGQFSIDKLDRGKLELRVSARDYRGAVFTLTTDQKDLVLKLEPFQESKTRVRQMRK